MTTDKHIPEENPKIAIKLENNPAIESFVTRFHATGKQTLVELLERAAIIADAHQDLGERQLLIFYSHIRLNRYGSTSRKMKGVGEKKTRFDPYTDILPDHWTTLAYLASLEDHEFQKLIDNKILHPFVTAETIRDHLAGPGKQARRKPQRLVLDLNKVEAAFAKKLKGLFDEFGLPLAETQSSTLDAFIGQNGQGGSDA